ncbi:hypothetical protein [Sphingomonas sp. R86521]
MINHRRLAPEKHPFSVKSLAKIGTPPQSCTAIGEYSVILEASLADAG